MRTSITRNLPSKLNHDQHTNGKHKFHWKCEINATHFIPTVSNHTPTNSHTHLLTLPRTLSLIPRSHPPPSLPPALTSGSSPSPLHTCLIWAVSRGHPVGGRARTSETSSMCWVSLSVISLSVISLSVMRWKMKRNSLPSWLQLVDAHSLVHPTLITNPRSHPDPHY